MSFRRRHLTIQFVVGMGPSTCLPQCPQVGPATAIQCGGSVQGPLGGLLCPGALEWAAARAPGVLAGHQQGHIPA